ncbi:hypothetical protein ACS0TY_020006 [Phlomoides rotata]
MVVWRILKERNNGVWTAAGTDEPTAVHLAHKFLHEWQEARNLRARKVTVRPACAAWHYPPQGPLKLNVDAAFFADSLEMWIGLTLWDCNGSHVYNRTLALPGLYASDEGEAIGLFVVFTWVVELDLRNVLIEMDAKLVVDAFNAPCLDSISVFGDIIEAYKHKFRAHPHCLVGWVVREANFVAHDLPELLGIHLVLLLGLSSV